MFLFIEVDGWSKSNVLSLSLDNSLAADAEGNSSKGTQDGRGGDAYPEAKRKACGAVSTVWGEGGRLRGGGSRGGNVWG